MSEDGLSRRKADHVEVVLAGRGRQMVLDTGLEEVRFEHVALPELALEAIDLTTTFLGRRLAAPLLVGAMTGGFAKGAAINHRLAEAAETTGIAFAVGSQRIALERGAAAGLDRNLRRLAPRVPILANIGGAQVGQGLTLEAARRIVELIEADALVVHLNPLQEAVQAGGDGDWRGVLAGIERLARGLGRPLVVKEVGFGLSATVARRLADCGVAALDVAGAGGTNWALVEGARAPGSHLAEVASAFAGWGIPTARAIREVRAACPGVALVASGGIASGVDVAKAIRLGADVAGIAAGLLEAATISTEAVVARLQVITEQLRVACFCTGSASLAALRRARLME